MAVQVWVGEKPEHPNERRAIVALANGLERLDGLYLILANFSVGGRTIDLVIMKQDAVFIIELKHCDGKVFGGVNGHWFVESANGERKRLNPGRRNPYNQVISYFHSLTNFLNEHRHDVLSAHKATTTDFRTCRRVVVIAPTIQEGSEIELDWKVELKGLDELPAFLVTERSSEIDLTEDEMLKIPELLHCTRWKEVDSLIAGVLPNWPSTNAPAVDKPSAQPEAAAEPPAPTPESAASPAAAPWVQRAAATLRTPMGRLALFTSSLALVLLLVLLRPAAPLPTADQPVLPVLVNATDAPISGVFPGGGDSSSANCIWSDYQPVGKRWDTRTQDWISVGLDASIVEAVPDVIVTLEQVAYCSDEITLTWSVQNNSNQIVEFPLREDNISIHDPLGNEYAISDSASQPGEVMRIGPGEQQRGTTVVLRPLSQNASSLLVRLKNKPFGETSFFVSLIDG